MDQIVLLRLLAESPAWLLTCTGILGLMVGSFLNVVIYRLPKMMEQEWRQQCAELDGEADNAPAEEPFTLSKPASTCPHCGHKIRFYENIPVLSYLFLRGKCSSCGTGISPRYPVIELITALLSVAVAWHFGWSWQTGAALLLTWGLIALTMIDFDHQLLPDIITLPLLWLGLGLSLFTVFVDSHTSIIGALAGYLSLWTVYQLFKLLTKKEGMGFGDFKLLAMLGAWMGWQALPVVILLSSMVGAAAGISMILMLGRDRQLPIPFGPYLAAAGWITLLWGDSITGAYLRFAGLGQ